jgi:hypothetical protein
VESALESGGAAFGSCEKVYGKEVVFVLVIDLAKWNLEDNRLLCCMPAPDASYR